jgi:hypothetical protein
MNVSLRFRDRFSVTYPWDGAAMTLSTSAGIPRHMTGRHAGHMDILRELIDGTTGR